MMIYMHPSVWPAEQPCEPTLTVFEYASRVQLCTAPGAVWMCGKPRVFADAGRLELNGNVYTWHTKAGWRRALRHTMRERRRCRGEADGN